jgi:hypothetical protein
MNLDAPNKLYVLKLTPLPNKIGNNILHRSGKHILWCEENGKQKVLNIHVMPTRPSLKGERTPHPHPHTILNVHVVPTGKSKSQSQARDNCWSLQAACNTAIFHHLLGTGCMQMETMYYGMINTLSILLGKVPRVGHSIRHCNRATLISI